MANTDVISGAIVKTTETPMSVMLDGKEVVLHTLRITLAGIGFGLLAQNAQAMVVRTEPCTCPVNPQSPNSCHVTRQSGRSRPSYHRYGPGRRHRGEVFRSRTILPGAWSRRRQRISPVTSSHACRCGSGNWPCLSDSVTSCNARPELQGAALRLFLRAVEQTLRAHSVGAGPGKCQAHSARERPLHGN